MSSAASSELEYFNALSKSSDIFVFFLISFSLLQIQLQRPFQAPLSQEKYTTLHDDLFTNREDLLARLKRDAPQ